jgi:hypothetical protein
MNKLLTLVVAALTLTGCHDIPGLTKTKEVVSQVAVDKAEFYHDLYELQYVIKGNKDLDLKQSLFGLSLTTGNELKIKQKALNVAEKANDEEAIKKAASELKAAQKKQESFVRINELVNSILESDAYTDIVQQLLELDEARGYDKADELCKAQLNEAIKAEEVINLVHEAEQVIKELS